MPSSKRPVCFISYSHEDIDRETLHYIKMVLERQSDNGYKIFLDEDLQYGENIIDFIAMLEKDVDAVLLLLTPSYKRKIIERIDGGVYNEYKIIVNRYQALEEQKKNGKKTGEISGYFALFPILFSGTNKISIPDDISHLKYIDLTGLRATKNRRGNPFVPAIIERKYVPEILKVVSTLKVIGVLKSKTFDDLYDSYYPRLFVELKADWDNPRDNTQNYIETLFVKTYAYKKIKSQAIYFLIGRKGSGKTTIRDLFAFKMRDNYVYHLSIIANEFKLEALYNLFEVSRTKAETTSVFPRLDCFSFAWDAFLTLCAMDALVKIRKSHALTPHQKRLVAPIVSFINEVSFTWSVGHFLESNAYFIYCFNKVIEFIDDCINGARPKEEFFYSDVQARFSHSRFLEFAFGIQNITAYNDIMKTLKKPFLISFDGFDSAFDNFRRDSIQRRADIKDRAMFEIEWLRSLVQLVLNMKQGPAHENPLHAQSDFCITVPHERFMEVTSTERDTYRYQNRFLALKWSGIELAILLRKRLEELAQCSTDGNKLPEERLNQVIKQAFKHIPIEIAFYFNDKYYQMPLFMYVLRHTFWRPREILLYYAQILSLAQALKKKGELIDTEVLRRTIKDTTRVIIKTEFINEFETSVINIEEIIGAFSRKKQVINYQNISSILSQLNFQFAYDTLPELNIDQKIEFLYRIGFLGVMADKEMINRLGLLTNHAFYFNEDEAVLNTVGSEGYTKYYFIIHPVFSEYLALDTSGNDLIMHYTWEYLHKMEAILFS